MNQNIAHNKSIKRIECVIFLAPSLENDGKITSWQHAQSLNTLESAA